MTVGRTALRLTATVHVRRDPMQRPRQPTNRAPGPGCAPITACAPGIRSNWHSPTHGRSSRRTISSGARVRAATCTAGPKVAVTAVPPLTTVVSHVRCAPEQAPPHDEQSKAVVFDRGESHRRVAVVAPRAHVVHTLPSGVAMTSPPVPETRDREHARRAIPDGRAIRSRGCPTSYRRGRSSRRDRCRGRRRTTAATDAACPSTGCRPRCRTRARGLRTRSARCRARSSRSCACSSSCAAVRAGHPFPVPYPPTRHPGSPWRKTNDTRRAPPVFGLLAERPQMPPPAGPS